MPETRIGLFPDVAGGYFLSRCKGHVGEYLGVVVPHINAGDALALGLADMQAEAASLGGLLDALRDTPVESGAELTERLCAHAAAHPAPGLHAPTLAGLHEQIDKHFAQPDVAAITASLRSDDSEWARQTLAQMAGHSPLMMSVTLEQIRRARHMALADEFRMERTLVRHCFNLRKGAASETVEGVRALAVDKDHQPRWSPATLAEVTPEMVQAFFEPVWPVHAHPLRDLKDA